MSLGLLLGGDRLRTACIATGTRRERLSTLGWAGQEHDTAHTARGSRVSSKRVLDGLL